MSASMADPISGLALYGEAPLCCMSTSICSGSQVSDTMAMFLQIRAWLNTWHGMYGLRHITCLFAADFCETKAVEDDAKAGVLAAERSFGCLKDDKPLAHGLGAWQACACCSHAPCLGAVYIAFCCILNTLGTAAAV